MPLSSLLDRLAGRLERADSLDQLAEPATAALSAALQNPTVRGAASGSSIGHPIHPLLVALPIGSFSAASYLDFAPGDHEAAARALVGLGLLTAVPSALTGASDWTYTSGAEQRVGLAHAAANTLALLGYTASWLARRRERQALGAALALGAAAALSVGGWLGGHLVYARGVGVDTTAFSPAEPDWQDTVSETELIEGEPMLVHAGGVPVLLVRLAHGIHALDDRCSHRGGPLHDGEIADGCVSCPWHGSKFRIDTGELVTGPATRPQRRWEVRTRYGTVQLRVTDEPGGLRTNVVV